MTLGLLAALPAPAAPAQECEDGCAAFSFEGLGDVVQIGTLSGPTTVAFGPSWFSLIDSDDGGSGSFANEPSPTTIAFSAGGFDPIDLGDAVRSVEVWYSAAAPVLPLVLSAYDGPSGTGNVVASASGTTVGRASDGAPCTGDPTGNYCLFDRLALTSDAGDVRSLRFTIAGGVSTQVAFDDLRVCRAVGTSYCGPAERNSSGGPATLAADGSARVADGCLALRAGGLPPSQFGYLLNSPQQGFVHHPPGSQGNLCLGGAIGRHTQDVTGTGDGEMTIAVDLAALPRPGGRVAVLVGETWSFTCWFRDQNPGPTSNFTDGVSILFR